MKAALFALAAAALLIGAALVMRGGTKNTGGYALVMDATGPAIKPTPGGAFAYFTLPDPTNGAVDYGVWDDLIQTSPTQAKISVGDLGPTGRRRAVRLSSRAAFDSGLFVIDLAHIPEGPGVWPAFWLTALEPAGSAWACNGEIDIIEGVNSIDAASSINTSTLHTSTKPGGAPCRQDGVPGISTPDCTSGGGTRSMKSAGAAGTCGCDGASPCPYSGCGVKASPFGWGFNRAGGGVYACELTDDGQVSIWFFPASAAPADLANGHPNPSSWPAPSVAFKACPGQFRGLQITLNTTLCGAWAGAVYPGGPAACEKYVGTADLSQAYWLINYIRAYKLAA